MKKNLLTSLLILSFTASTAYSGDTISHGIQGFALHAAVAKLLGADKTTTYTAGAIGGLIGMYPDLAGAYGKVTEHNDDIYRVAHHAPIAISLAPSMKLHLMVDVVFHNPGKGWKPEAWIYETIMIVLDVVIMYYLIKWIENI